MSKNNHNNNNQQKENATTEEEKVEEVVEETKEEEKEDNKEKVVVNTPKKEEKKIEDLKGKTNNARIKEIDEEIEVLKKKLDKTFSAIQQVTYDEKIKQLKAEKAKILEKKLESTNISVAGETMKDSSPVNNVIPAGRGIVMDSRTTTLSIANDV